MAKKNGWLRAGGRSAGSPITAPADPTQSPHVAQADRRRVRLIKHRGCPPALAPFFVERDALIDAVMQLQITLDCVIADLEAHRAAIADQLGDILEAKQKMK